MADNIGNKAAHDYHLDTAPTQDGFYVKGAAQDRKSVGRERVF